MYILEKGQKVDQQFIKDSIDHHYNHDRKRYDRLERYYEGEHDILRRKKAQGLKNNKVVVNHAKFITKINSSYLLDNPVQYQYIPTGEKEAADNTSFEYLMNKYKEYALANLDKKLAQDTSKYGVSYEYTFVGEDGELKSRKLKPQNCILFKDDSMDHNNVLAIMYSSHDIKEDEYKNVIVVDSEKIVNYSEKLTPTVTTPHIFGKLPVIEYINNDEYIGDFEDVMSLIDAYDIIQSDRVNDKEQLVEALLVLYGITLTKEQMESARENRVMSVPSKQNGAEVEYVTKILSESDIEILKKSIENDIHKISMTPNMSDENFIGNSSGVALKYKLLPFELNIRDKEVPFEEALKYRFSLYNIYYNSYTVGKVEILNLYEIDAIFKRSLPQNDLETSQTINNLSQLLDKETSLSQISFVKDPSKVLARKEKENEEEASIPDEDYEAANAVLDVESKAREEAIKRNEAVAAKLNKLVGNES